MLLQSRCATVASLSNAAEDANPPDYRPLLHHSQTQVRRLHYGTDIKTTVTTIQQHSAVLQQPTSTISTKAAEPAINKAFDPR